MTLEQLECSSEVFVHIKDIAPMYGFQNQRNARKAVAAALRAF